jgi:hydrogenase nickel incorporation protein HypB
METRILTKNDALAAKNRAWFAGREILMDWIPGMPGLRREAGNAREAAFA